METIKVSETVQGLIDSVRELNESNPRRELSLAITKLEEAKMWIERVEK